MKKYSMMTFPLKTYLPPLVTKIPAVPETFVLGYHFLGKLGFHKMTVFFNLAFLLPLEGELDLEKMKNAIRMTVEEEPVLKSYLMKDKEGFWLVEKQNYQPSVECIEVQGRNWKEKEEWVDNYAKTCAKKDYDLFNPEIEQSKFLILRLSEKKHYLLFLGTHIFYDYGGATSVFSRVFRHYEMDEPIKKNDVGFGEFLERERAFIYSEEGRKDYAYWEKHFEGYKKKNLPKIRCSRDDFDPSDLKIEIDKQILERIAQNNKTGVFNVTMLAIQMAYAKMVNCYDCGANYIISNRSDEEFRNSAGMLMRMMFNRIKLKDEMTVAEMQIQMRRGIGEEYLHHKSAARICSISPLMIVDESMSDISGEIRFNGNPVQLRAVLMDDEMISAFPTGMICIRIIPGIDKHILDLMGNVTYYGTQYKQFGDNIKLALRFMDCYADQPFSEYMKEEITIENVDFYEDTQNVSVVLI